MSKDEIFLLLYTDSRTNIDRTSNIVGKTD